MNSIPDIVKRYKTLRSHKVRSLPIVILMPHSACNCRCIMCDIWKDNKNLKQLSEEDVSGLLATLKKFNTKVVVMSGGEALLNRNFFSLCKMLHDLGIKITLLSTGISLKQHAEQVVKYIHDVVISLDGNEAVHNEIRQLPNAFAKLKEGVEEVKRLNPHFRITARTVVQRENFKVWPQIIESAKELKLNQISFLPADVSSTAFNREEEWNDDKKMQIQPGENELGEFNKVLEELIVKYASYFQNGFIAESPEKLRKIYLYYAALYGHNPYPFKKCNAPWVSTVIEADGTVRPCFFLDAMGSIKNETLEEILNKNSSVNLRKGLNTQANPVCEKCVCYLNLSPLVKV